MAIHMGQGGRDGDQELMAEINTTPLIDVMLVLLIMMIITIPVQTHAVKLDISPASTRTSQPQIITVEVTAEAAILWDHQQLTDRQDLEVRMKDATAGREQKEIHLSVDPAAPYALVAEILATAYRNGMANIGIVETAQGGDQ